MHHLRIAGVLTLAAALIVSGCGQSDDAAATLTIASVPKAEVFVDGVSHGPSGQALTLPAGTHDIELRLEKFISHEESITLTAGAAVERDVTLAAKDPSDPTVIALLAECEGVDVAPFVAPETTRGSRTQRAEAVLLWPARDVREDGLVSYAIEADETYAGDATLEFRVGRKVLYREAFNPETVTTVRSVPAEVREEAKVGQTITWGLYYEDSRRPIKASFKIVNRPKADRQLEKLRESRHVQRQPEITREILAATVLENNRLYTEALVANLKIATDHPESTQPYRGIVTTLRRLDAEHSELFAFVSPFVSGKGGHAGIQRPGNTAGGGMGLGIEAWAPVQKHAGGSATLPAEATPGRTSTQGVTPTGGADTQPTPSGEATGEPVPTPASGASVEAERARITQEMTALQGGLDAAKEAYDEAVAHAADATAAAVDAEKRAGEAEDAARVAREAVEGAENPTREQQQEMVQAGQAAEEAREAAAQAREHAERMTGAAADLQVKLEQAQAQLAARAAQLERLVGTQIPAAPRVDPAQQAASDALARAEDAASVAAKALAEARSALELAQTAYDRDANEHTAEALAGAQEAFDSATQAEADARALVDTARAALDKIAEQMKDGIR